MKCRKVIGVLGGKGKKRFGGQARDWRMESMESRVMFSAVMATVTDTSVIAGARTQTISVPVVLSQVSSSVVKVNYSTMNVTALAGADYEGSSGTLTFAPGQWLKMVNVKVLKDRGWGSDEAFNVLLTGATNASFSTPGWWNYGRVSIRNSVAAARPTVTVGNATVLAGGTEAFHVTLSAASSKAISLRYHTAGGTATAANYTAGDGILTIPAGWRTGTILVGTKAGGGSVTKNFGLVLTAPANGVLGNTVAYGNITYVPPTVGVSDATVAEGTSGNSALTFTVTLSKASAEAVTVHYATSDIEAGAEPPLGAGGPEAGSPANFARAGLDYVATSGTLTFAPGQTSKTVSVTVDGDTQVERDEIMNLVLSNASHATIARTTATGTIVNDDVGALSVGSASAAVVNGDGSQTMEFTVTLSSESWFPVTVGYATEDGTAVAGTDYTAASGTLTFSPGQTSKTVDVTVSGNSVSSLETLHLNLSGPTNATIAAAAGLGTIEAAENLSDNLDGPSDGFDNTDLIAANFTTGGSDVDLISVTLINLSDPTSVKIYTDSSGHPGTEVGTLTYSGDNTFTASGITLTANTTYWVVNEGGGSQYTNGGGSGEGFEGGALVSSDGGTSWSGSGLGGRTFPMQVKTTWSGPGISIDSPSVSETVGDNTTQTLTYTVTLSGAASFPVTVHYATEDGTAEAGTDYTAASGTLTFAAGETTKTIDVTVTGNTLGADETLNLNLSTAVNGTISTATGVGAIASVTAALSDNLGETALGGGPLRTSQLDAQAFSTGASSVVLGSVTIPIELDFDLENPDTTTYTMDLEIFSDADASPGSWVGTLTAPESYPVNTQNVTFGGNGIALSANTNYWVVARALVGAFDWNVTTSTNGNGVGFNATAKISGDEGMSWNSYPYAWQMKVIAN